MGELWRDLSTTLLSLPGLVTNPQHRTHTLWDTPECPEVHLSKGQERCPRARLGLTPSPLPFPPFHVPLGHRRGGPTCLAPALVGPWCCPSSLLFLLTCDGKAQRALMSPLVFRKEQLPNEEICSQKSLKKMMGPTGSFGPAVASGSLGASWEGGIGF